MELNYVAGYTLPFVLAGFRDIEFACFSAWPQNQVQLFCFPEGGRWNGQVK
jgi:hypothetical protein